VYARRDEIEIMKLVGATDGYVRAPFLLEGALQGLCGAALAAAGLLAVQRLVLPRAAAAFAFASGPPRLISPRSTARCSPPPARWSGSAAATWPSGGPCAHDRAPLLLAAAAPQLSGEHAARCSATAPPPRRRGGGALGGAQRDRAAQIAKERAMAEQ